MKTHSTSTDHAFRILLLIGLLLCAGCAVSRELTQKRPTKPDQEQVPGEKIALTDELIEKVSNKNLKEALQAIEQGKASLYYFFEVENDEYHLYIAAYEKHEELVDLLLDKGAKLDEHSGEFLMPIDPASTCEALRIIKKLCEKAEPGLQGDGNTTPLTTAQEMFEITTNNAKKQA